jgi:hypothetical protein
VVALVAGSATLALVLIVAGQIAVGPGTPVDGGPVYYVVAYHYGYAFFDERFAEVDRIEVTEGDTITLTVVPAQILGRDAFLAFARRSLERRIGGLEPGDLRIAAKIDEDLLLGNVEHIVGIAGHPVYVTTNVGAVLHGRPFPDGTPRTLHDVVRQRDPAIKSVTVTAKRVGRFDVLCVDSGMDGAGTCGWGHKWMVAREAFVVRPAH